MEIKDHRRKMEIKDHLRLKRLMIADEAVSKIEEILKNGGEPNLPIILKELEDFDEYAQHFWGMVWIKTKNEYVAK